ncbi:hypothetical protein ACNR9Z_001643 [Candidozyma auris]
MHHKTLTFRPKFALVKRLNMIFKSTPVKNIVGEKIASVLPDYGKPWFKVGHLLQLNLLLIVPLLSSAAGGYDGSLMNGLQSMTEWREEFGNPQGTMLGFVNAAMCFGALIALPISGWFPDLIGRKKTLLLGIFGIIVATIIQATSTTLAQLIVSRFVVGFAGQVAGQPSPMLIAELSYPTYRGKATSMYNCLFYIGGILASWTCYGCTDRGDNWAWRIPVILQAGYPAVQLVFFWFVPESISQALNSLVKRNGKTPSYWRGVLERDKADAARQRAGEAFYELLVATRDFGGSLFSAIP